MSDLWQRLLMKPNDHDAGCRTRRMPENIREIAIQRHKSSTFGSRHFQQAIIVCARKFLIVGERNIVTGPAEDTRNTVREILIELDRSHGQAVTGRTLSRASSAAYANAAEIASFGKPG